MIFIRSALRASRLQIARHMPGERLLLAFLGGCLGASISVWACRNIGALTAGTNADMLDLRVDWVDRGFRPAGAAVVWLALSNAGNPTGA